jgi:hypothetical protein
MAGEKKPGPRLVDTRIAAVCSGAETLQQSMWLVSASHWRSELWQFIVGAAVFAAKLRSHPKLVWKSTASARNNVVILYTAR